MKPNGHGPNCRCPDFSNVNPKSIAPAGETPEERIRRKAAAIRTALLKDAVVWSPDPDLPFEQLSPARQEKWLKLARTYVEVM